MLEEVEFAAQDTLPVFVDVVRRTTSSVPAQSADRPKNRIARSASWWLQSANRYLPNCHLAGANRCGVPSAI